MQIQLIDGDWILKTRLHLPDDIATSSVCWFWQQVVQHSLGSEQHTRAVGSRGSPPPPNFYRSVKPILARGADYAPQITTCPHGFSPLPTVLHTWRKQWRNEKSLNFRDRSSWSKICSKSGTGVNWLNLGRELLRSLIVEAIINECDKGNALRER